MTKHTILMMNREDDTEATYNDVINYEICNGFLTLKLEDGNTATFTNDEWLMFDLTPTRGWNHSPNLYNK